MSVELLPSQSFINLPSLSTSSKAPRFSPEAAPKYLKLPKSIQLKCTSRKLCFALGQRTPHEVESQVGHKDGVIIVDHGSRRKESNLLLNEFVLMFKSKTGYAIVEPAHMDIPSLAEAAAKEHPGIPYLVTAPLGLHELLVDVVKDRIEYCLSRVDGEADECSVCAGTGRCQLKVKEPKTSNAPPSL